MANDRVKDIKHNQRESVLHRQIANLFMQITQDSPHLSPLSVTRVSLSSNKSQCTIFLYCAGGLKEFERLRKDLVLYKSSLRTALSKSIHGRYTPDLRFTYDSQLEKQQSVDNIIEKLKDEGKL